MEFPTRTTAILFLALATQALAILPVAASGSKHPCSHGDVDGKRCPRFHVRAGQGMNTSDAFIASSAKRRSSLWSRRNRSVGGETAIRQLSPLLRARTQPALRFNESDRLICGDASRAKPCASERSLADALIQPPNAATAKILREAGLPIIPGVPPIVILRPAGELRPDEGDSP